MTSRKKEKEPRKRLTGEEARARILDAAVERLGQGGPQALTLADLAHELGVSHQAILHHFGSRDGLVAAVVRRALERLQAELAGGLRVVSEADHDRSAGAMLDRAFEVLADQKHGRLLAWLALGDDPDAHDLASDVRPLELFAKMAHALREREVPGATYRDTLFTMMLISYVVLGSAVFEVGTQRAANLDADPTAATRAFREWFRELVVAHLEKRVAGG